MNNMNVKNQKLFLTGKRDNIKQATDSIDDFDLRHLYIIVKFITEQYSGKNIAEAVVMVHKILIENRLSTFSEIINVEYHAFVIYKLIHHIKFICKNVSILNFAGMMKETIIDKWKTEDNIFLSELILEYNNNLCE